MAGNANRNRAAALPASGGFELTPPAGFRLTTVATSHGWFDLPPFRWRPEIATLATTFQAEPAIVDIAISQPAKESIRVDFWAATAAGNKSASGRPQLEAKIKGVVASMLGFSLNLDRFFKIAGKQYSWAKKIGAGRLLRSPTAFEDAVKMLATTNCSWALTKKMIERLVDALGKPGPLGHKAFPLPTAMAEMDEGFFRNEMKAGYRAAAFKALATSVATGALDIEAWPTHSGEYRELLDAIRGNRGFGPYSAENLCRLFGRFDGLGLDSWCRNNFEKLHGRFEGNLDKAIYEYYEPFGQYRGLAMWLDLTKAWHDDGRYATNQNL